MSLALTIFLFLVGLVLIIKGGDWFVDAAAWMAEASGMPKFLIGATIVSVATTLPEIIVSTMAAAEGSTDMAIGNAIGSVTANIGLIMAVSLLFLPAVIQRKQFAFKGALMVGSVVLLWALCLDGQLTVVEAVIVLLLFVAYIIENVHTAKAESRNGAAEIVTVDKSKKTLWKNIGIFVLGAACLVVGSRLLVDNGTELAKILGVSERVIAGDDGGNRDIAAGAGDGDHGNREEADVDVGRQHSGREHHRRDRDPAALFVHRREADDCGGVDAADAVSRYAGLCA